MTNKLAIKMWDAYAKQAGGKTFDGKPLPTWEELGEERQSCWNAAAAVTADRIEQLETALRNIAENNSVRAGLDKDMYRRWRRVATDAIDVARAALGEKKDER
jgi:tripartite-type tricarboxylate transporter receptor subunit TctC